MSLGGGFNQAVNEAVNAAIDDVSSACSVARSVDVIIYNINDHIVL